MTTSFPELYVVRNRNGIGDNIQFPKKTEYGDSWVKVSFTPKSAIFNNQRIEAQIYEHVLSGLLSHTPHLPEWYATVKFQPDPKRIPSSKWLPDYNITKPATALILERINGVLMKDDCDPLIMFQILYTIECFERVGLKHNDLHIGNVMVSTLPEPVLLSYKVGDRIYSFKTDKFVQIIDFDRACIFHPEVEWNFFLEDEELGYNSFIPGFDTCHLLMRLEGKMEGWIKSVAPKLRMCFKSNTRIPWDSDPLNYVPDNITLMESIQKTWPKLFTQEEGVVYMLPDQNRQVIPKMSPKRFSTKPLLFRFPHLAQIRRDLFIQGYDWFGLAWDLYRRQGKKGRKVFASCLQETCPITISKPIEAVKSLINYPKIQHKITPELGNYTFLDESFGKEEEPVIVFKEFPEEEIQKTRLKMLECWKTYLPAISCKFLESSEPNTEENFIQKTRDYLELFTTLGKRERGTAVYCMYCMYQKTLWVMNKYPNFIKSVLGKIKEFEGEGIDLSTVLTSDEIIPIETVLGEFWRKNKAY